MEVLPEDKETAQVKKKFSSRTEICQEVSCMCIENSPVYPYIYEHGGVA